jgi:predicted MFS family arabinose efflux permease
MEAVRAGATLSRAARRRGTLAAAYVLWVVMAGTTVPNALWSVLEGELGVSTSTTALIFATNAAAVVVALIAFGAASDRLGRRPVLATAVGLAAAASLTVLAGGVTALVIGRVLSGLAVGLASGAAAAYLSDLHESAAGHGALLSTGATMAGLATGPLLAGVLAALGANPMRAPFVIHLALLVPALLVVRGPETVRVRAPRRRRLAVPVSRMAFAGAALAGFAANAQLGIFGALAPTLLVGSLGLDSVLLAGAAGGLLFAAAAVGQLAAAPLRPALRLGAGMAVLVIGSLALVAALGTRSLALFLAATAIGGLGGGVGFGAGLAAASGLAAADERAAVSSTWFVAAYLGLVAPVAGAGALVEAGGAQRAASIFALAITLLAAAAVVLSRRRSASRQLVGSEPF